MKIRPIDPHVPAEVELVAQRMRRTLVEVLGEARGRALYTMDWLRERVRFHLDAEQSTGQVFLSEDETGHVTGHTIVRLERSEAGAEFGLFSTIFVEPESRGRGFASELLQRGETWFRERGLSEAATYTAETNANLIRLFERQGYAIREASSEMVRLAKALSAG